jgi:hypothetical protein
MSGDVHFTRPGRREFRSVSGSEFGRINLTDFAGEAGGDLSLFFDLADNSEAATLVNRINQGAPGLIEASLSNFRGTNVDNGEPVVADVVVRFNGRGLPGSNQLIDFSFLGGCGPGIAVNAVGVPEPSSASLAVAGIFLALLRPRGRRCD